jgi:hypothetical protein
MLAGLKQACVLSNGLFLGVPRQLLEGSIRPSDRCFAVSDEDGIVGSLQGRGPQLKQLIEALAAVSAGRVSLPFLH